MLYHHRRELLRPGDIVLPGGWGDRVQSMTGAFSLIESVFEDGRRALSPSSPSRLTATFAYESRATADVYFDLLDWRPAYLYEVEHVDAAAPRHRGSLDWLSPELGNRPIPEIMVAAKWYWLVGFEDGHHLEVISPSPLRIVKLVRSKD